MEDTTATIDQRFEGTFQGQDYIVIVKSLRNETLNIHLESKYEPIWWTGSFTAGYLEDLTQRTGVRRKYAEFIDALLQGFQKRTESCNVDILTFSDLEAMRSGGNAPGRSSSSASNTSSTPTNNNNNALSQSSASMSSSSSKKQNNNNSNSNSNKRYLIVTTMTQNGDRVHYPLSLNLDDIDNVEQLKAQLRKMKLEVEDLKEKASSAAGSSTVGRFSESDSQSSSKTSFSSRLRAAAGDTSGFLLQPSQQQLNAMKQGGGAISQQEFFLMDQTGTSQMGSVMSSMNSFNATSISAIEQLKSENDLLKTKIKRIEETSSQKKGAVELDSIVKNKLDLEEELENTKRETFYQVERLRQQLISKEAELARSRNQFRELQKEIVFSTTATSSSSSQMSDPNDENANTANSNRLRSIITRVTEESEEEISKQRKLIEAQTKELERYLTEAETLKLTDRKQKNRIKQLELELESAVKRVSTRATTDRLYQSPHSRNSPSNASTGGNSSHGSTPRGTMRRANSGPTKTGFTSLRNQQQGGVNPTSGAAAARGGGASRTGISPSYSYNARKNSPTNSNSTTNAGGLNNNNRSNSNSRRQLPGSGSVTLNNRNSSPALRNNTRSPAHGATASAAATAAQQSSLNRNKLSTSPSNNYSNSRLNNNNNSNNRGNTTVGVGGGSGSMGGYRNNSGNRMGVTVPNSLGNNNNNHRVSPSTRNTAMTQQQGGAQRLSPASRYDSNKGMQSNATNRLNQSGRTGGGYIANQSAAAAAAAAGGVNRPPRTQNSPSTRFGNYLQARDPNQLKKIDEVQAVEKIQESINSGRFIPKDFNDFHLESSGSGAANIGIGGGTLGISSSSKADDIDSRLDKLQSLLKLAKN